MGGASLVHLCDNEFILPRCLQHKLLRVREDEAALVSLLLEGKPNKIISLGARAYLLE